MVTIGLTDEPLMLEDDFLNFLIIFGGALI